jgi:hypothetical protein
MLGHDIHSIFDSELLPDETLTFNPNSRTSSPYAFVFAAGDVCCLLLFFGSLGLKTLLFCSIFAFRDNLYYSRFINNSEGRILEVWRR